MIYATIYNHGRKIEAIEPRHLRPFPAIPGRYQSPFGLLHADQLFTSEEAARTAWANGYVPDEMRYKGDGV